MTDSNPTIVKASAKGIGISPRKVGEVASLVRGRTVADALTILEHTPRRAAQPVSKLIASAQANATNNHGLKSDGLVISEIFATSGIRYKRYRVHGRGRINPFQRKTSNLYVRVTGETKPVKKPAAKKTAAKKEAK